VSLERPPNIKIKKNKNGISYGWQPGSRDLAKAKADPDAPSFLRFQTLGGDMLEAFTMARALNERLAEWRGGSRVDLQPGTVGWLMHHFIRHEDVVSLSKSSQDAYQRQANYITGLKLKSGATFSDKFLSEIRIKTADNMHKKLVERHGLDTGNRCVKAIRYAWDLVRITEEEYIPKDNPFAALKMKHRERQETNAATYEQLTALTSAAIAMGEIGFAFGLRLMWDFHIRGDEVFALTSFEDWRPERREQLLFVRTNKTGNGKWQPLDDPDSGECLFPELENLFRMLPYSEGNLCQREKRHGRRIYENEWRPISDPSKIFNRVRSKAGITAAITLASVRHGGLTELGDANVDRDLIRSRSAHKQASTLDRYVHPNIKQAVKAQKMRLKQRNG